MASYQPYVEDYNSELSEAVPLTRRQTTKRSSGLSNSTSADASSYETEGNSVSDSGYSSHAEAGTPRESPPPRKSTTPAPPSRTQTQSARPSRSSSNPAPPPFTRPSGKVFPRTVSPAVPRNIPSSYNTVRRESSPATSAGGSDDCDCPDCGKVPSKPVTSGSSPSRSNGVWPVPVPVPAPEHSYHGYSSSPSSSAYAPFQYPSEYDGYNAKTVYPEFIQEPSSSRRERSPKSSMPPLPRPVSTFVGSSATSSSHTPSGSWSQSSYNSGYSHHSSSPALAPPTPASTCPPSYGSSMYAPPPMDTSPHGPSPRPTYDNSPYAPPVSAPSYGYTYAPDPWAQSPVPPAPNYHQAPEPSYHPVQEYSSMPPPPPIPNRRNSMRAQANAGAAIPEPSSDYHHTHGSHRRERRPSNRVHNGERPVSWYGQPQFQDVPNRSVSVPPVQAESAPISSSSRRLATPQPPRRRDSNTSRGSGDSSSRHHPSSLSRAMESCAIDDEPPHRSSHHGHSHHRSSGHHEHHHALARRDTGTMMQSSRSNRSSDSDSSGHSYNSGREELVVLDSDEPFTMRYPAGIPVKLQLNGGHTPRRISLKSRDKNENVEFSIAYRYVQQRQQQVHAQLQHGAQMEHYDRRTTASEYPQRGYERQRV